MIPVDLLKHPERFAGLLNNLAEGAYIVDLQRRVRFWNTAAERISGFSAEEMVGQCCADGLLMSVDGGGCSLCQSRCPLVHTMQDQQLRHASVYMHHKFGHRIAVNVRCISIQDEQGRAIGAMELFSNTTPNSALDQEMDLLRNELYRDPLTGVYNRRYMDHILDLHIYQAERLDHALGLLFIDLDHFKNINDQYGHNAGDLTLKTLAKTIANAIRPGDILGRWGGEEFLVVLPRVDAAELATVAARIGALIRTSHIHAETHDLQTTASVGGTLLAPKDDAACLVARADAAMYRAKTKGRNRYVIDTRHLTEVTA